MATSRRRPGIGRCRLAAYRPLAVARSGALVICIIYDCLFPHTVGGAERWYRNLAEHLAHEGHDVTYLTLRQWGPGEAAQIDSRVRVVAAGPRLALYTKDGRRRILPPLLFGLGVLWHLFREGSRYDAVHTASFPYFSLLAAALARRRHAFQLVVDWHEVWSPWYWRDYLGPLGGRIGLAVQRRCVRVRQRAFCFSQLHAARLYAEGLSGRVVVLTGQYLGSHRPRPARQVEPLVVFAGRLIPEKQATSVVKALAVSNLPGIHGIVFGDGPERRAVLQLIAALQAPVEAPGFVPEPVVEDALGRSLCMLLPSRREGYGMIVIEAASHGTPSIVVAGPDNAATERIVSGENGFVVLSDAPEELAAAIEAVAMGGHELRERTLAWFREHIEELSIECSVAQVLQTYADDRE